MVSSRVFNKKYEEKVRETQDIGDTEQWALAVCAIETSRIGDRNFIAGLPKTLRNQKKMKKILAKHWEIYDEEARNQIAQLPAARGYLGVERLQ